MGGSVSFRSIPANNWRVDNLEYNHFSVPNELMNQGNAIYAYPYRKKRNIQTSYLLIEEHKLT